MDYKIDGKDILLKQNDFALDDTLDCGQAFRWEKISENAYQGAFLNKKLVISCENGNDIFRLHNTTESDLLTVWKEYFDLDTDYGEIKRRFSEDETLSKACAYAGGIRILKQDSWEALSSFIISQNNNIPRITGIISRLCENFGERISDEYGGMWTFPDAGRLAALSPEDLAPLRAGFRVRYILDASVKVADGTIDLDSIYDMSYDDGKAYLKTITGVGDKVADCVLLFAYHKTSAFPTDVWIKRIVAEYYSDGLPECMGEYKGIAQQYLFEYFRKHSSAT